MPGNCVWNVKKMLDGLRAIAKTWFGKILGAFLIVGLAGFGISNVLLDLGSSNVATVGNQTISTRAFQRAYNDRLSQFAQQIGRMPTAEEASAMGVPSMVLVQLGSEAALNQLGENIGIGVSDARLSKMLREDPSFGDILGKFDPRNFQQVLQANGFTEEEYFDLQRNAARRQQVAQGLFVDAPLPEAAVELVNRYAGDKRTIDYFVLSSGTALPPADPTEDELAAYLKEHQADYRTKETRTADMLVLTPDAIAATKTITDADVAAEYERTKEQRVKIERRAIKQVPLATAEQQSAFESGKAAGKTFDALLTETGLTASDVGNLTQADITDADLATAAFGLAQGDFAIIPGVGGKRAITVTAIEPGGQITLEEASAEIKAALAMTQARTEYVDILDQIEELRAAFQPLADIAKRFNLPLAEVKVTASGEELSALAGIPEAERAKVATAIFAAADEKLSPTIAISANNNVWFDLKGTEAARDQTLDEVRDAVVAAWIAEKTEAEIVAQTDKALADIKAGTPIADAAAAVNQFSVLSQPFTRSGDGTPVISAAVANAAFGGGEGYVGTAVNGDGDHVVFQVVEITPAETTTNEAAKGMVAETRQNSLYSDFIGGLRDTTGMQINQKALGQLLALDTSGN
jgi:peptidyl-prolyl cis-trans isomerase D